MKRFRIPLLLWAVVLAACAGRPELRFASDPQAQFSGIKTWAWFDEIEVPRGGGTVDGQFIDQRVRQAVEADLAKKGLRPATEGRPDIYVAYTVDVNGLFTRDRWGSYSWWAPYAYHGVETRKIGALALDIREADRKLIWRGAYTGLVGTNPEAVGRDIDGAVSSLLAKFPPPEKAK